MEGLGLTHLPCMPLISLNSSGKKLVLALGRSFRGRFGAIRAQPRPIRGALGGLRAVGA